MEVVYGERCAFVVQDGWEAVDRKEEVFGEMDDILGSIPVRFWGD